MNEWLLLILATTLGSLVSLIGGVLLVTKRLPINKVQRIAIPFAAGALLAAALLDLLPEAFESGEMTSSVTMLVLVGFILFFALERFLGWFHHHHEHADVKDKRRQSTKSLIVVGDTLHNAIDGMVIGAAFLADPSIGIITTIAIAAHEIPQEVGDFGILLSLGMRRRNVLFVNLLSAFATVLFASLAYAIGGNIEGIEPVLLAIAAGMFIYIAASDLVPTIHEEPSMRVANYQTLIFLFGIVLVGITTTIAHEVVPHVESDSHDHSETHHENEH